MDNDTNFQFCIPVGGDMGDMGDMMSNMKRHLLLSSSSDDGSSSSGMIMYMDGFHFSLKGNQSCLNLYFPSWTLDTYWKFVAAMMTVLMMGFFTEGLSKLRYRINAAYSNHPNAAAAAAAAANDNRATGSHSRSHRSGVVGGGTGGRGATSSTSTSTSSSSSSRQHLIISILHAFQALMGYMLMLAGMTFSVELLVCVITGLGMGYAYFFASSNDATLEGHVTTNPCCNYMQQEADETTKRSVEAQDHQPVQQTLVQSSSNPSATRNAIPNLTTNSSTTASTDHEEDYQNNHDHTLQQPTNHGYASLPTTTTTTGSDQDDHNHLLALPNGDQQKQQQQQQQHQQPQQRIHQKDNSNNNNTIQV